MECCLSLLAVLVVTFYSICLAIMFLTDSDIMTFLSTKFGKTPENAYNGKVAWVTGASSGIGEAIAKELAKAGAKVVLSARRPEELERVKKECLGLNKKLTAKDVMVLPLDMLKNETHEEALNKIVKEYGRLDVLVSNAGRSQRAHWHEIDIQVDKDLFELNVFSVVNMNRIVVKHFLKNGSGQLVVVSSVGGKIGIPNSGTYAASKHALHGYFEGLRVELGHIIDITMLCPGPVFSGVLTNAFTNKPGEQVNQDMQSTDRRLTAERCGYLCVVAMANKLNESWQGLLPVIPLMYLFSYQPYIAARLSGLMGAKYYQKVRDSRDTLKKSN